jgi:exonuclease III
MPPLHLVSWNVAGWASTLKSIRDRHASLSNFLDLHKIDILCLQEVKATDAKLSDQPGMYGANEPDVDLFFANAQAKSGSAFFNGVATVARKGLTRCADRAPLRAAWLDEQGRCIETDHGAFVLLNVYAPFDGRFAIKFPEKMAFLLRLKARMDELEAQGRAVVLVRRVLA